MRLQVPGPALAADSETASESAQAGDDFADRFQRSARVLWTLAAAILGDRSQAEDIVQEAAVIGLQKRGEFSPGTSFVAWMGRIVRYVALNHLRARRRAAICRADSPLVARAVDGRNGQAPSVSAEGRLDGEHGFDDELMAALRELKPAARACLLLRSVLELDYTEIAAMLGLPEGTAMSHVHRARRALRRRLEEVSR